MNATIDPAQLSYTEMVMDASGSIVSREEKAHMRQQYGFCLSCQDTPVLLVDFQRARLNPLWSSKKPRTADGECLNGKCLRCNPHIIPTASCVPVRSGPIPSASSRSVTSCESTGSSGLPMESFHSSSSGRRPIPSGSSTSSSRRPAAGGHGSFTVHELSEPRRARSTDQVPLTVRDSRPQAPRRTVSFDRTAPHGGNATVRGGGRRQPLPARALANQSSAGELTSASAGNVTPRVPVRSPSLYEPTRPTMIAATIRPVAPVRTISDDAPLQCMQTALPASTTTLERSTSIEQVPVAPGESMRSLDCHPSSVSSCDEEKHAEDEEWSSTSIKSAEPLAEEDQIVYDLRSLMDGMKGEDVAFLAEILLGSMEANEQHEHVQAYCLEAMAEIFQDAVTESTAMISKIVSVMKTLIASLAVQRGGCKVLGALACNPNNCVVLIRAKACESVSEALSRHIGDAVLVEVAIGALRKLSTNWEARTKLLDHHVADRVAEAMQCHPNAETQRDGCALLSNIAVDGEKRRVCAVSVDVLDATVGSIKSHPRDPIVVQSACFALKNFTYDAANLRSLTKVFGVFDVLHEAATNDLDGCEDCFVVLERIQLARAEDESLEEQARQSMIQVAEEGSEDGRAVIEILRVMRDLEWSATVVAQGFQILCALIASPFHKEEIEKKEIQSQLMGFIEQYVTDIRVQTEAQALLSAVSDDVRGPGELEAVSPDP